MTYQAFLKTVLDNGWRLSQLRCDEPPSDALLAFMDQVGLARYERYVKRLEAVFSPVKRGGYSNA